MNVNNETNLQNIDINLLKNIATDRRLSAIDVRILLYFISMKNEHGDEENKGKRFYFNGKQEDVADALNVTRENVNRAITKLVNFGYLYTINDVPTDSDTYLKRVYNIDTGQFEFLIRKVRAGEISYIISDDIKAVFTITEFMNLINVDVKNSKDKLLTEDVYKTQGVLYRNIITGEIKDFLTQAEVESKEFEEVSKVKVLDRVLVPEVRNLFKIFEIKYGYKALEEGDLINVSDIVMLVGGIELFKDRCDERVYNAILSFKNRYLDNLIDYYMCRNILNENFLHLYNKYNKDVIKNRQINKSYLMKLIHMRNRDTTQTRNKFRKILELIGVPEQDFYTFVEVLEVVKDLQKEEILKGGQLIDGLFNLPIDNLCEIYEVGLFGR